ncbi:protein kinase domain-containing protein [Archangium sp.]|uniref:protein kinase domain-containing protein n=1 Tax=Archangium sp. TaxID=1872627 RepID=UPI002D32D7A8|nr:protein kinase [Archangium sp.]HYO59125.1 protein kinase [Archangium sp.]
MPGAPFLVMECVEGESPGALRRREKPGLHRTLELMSAVAAGLAHAHAHHVIHRNLKPSNVMLTRESENVQRDHRTTNPDSDLDRIASKPVLLKPVLFKIAVNLLALNEWDLIGWRALEEHLKVRLR